MTEYENFRWQEEVCAEIWVVESSTGKEYPAETCDGGVCIRCGDGNRVVSPDEFNENFRISSMTDL